MTDISSISGYLKLTSQSKVSLESAELAPKIISSQETQELEKLAVEIEQLGQAFTLVNEIRVALESALRDLS